MRIGLVVVLCLTFKMVDAQVYNYVPNPSFELMDSCPTQAGQLDRLKQWFNPTFGTTDYFHTCSNAFPGLLNCGVPGNAWGFQNPRNGNGYTGFANTHGGYNYREYI